MKLRYIIYMILGAAILAGCAADEPTTKKVLVESPYVSFNFGSTRSDLDWHAEVKSRAAVKEDIKAYPPPSIGVFGYNNRATSGLSYNGVGEVFKNVEMFYKNGERYNEYVDANPSTTITDWPYMNILDPEKENMWPYENRMPWVTSAKYKFFGYAPYDPDNIEARQESYDGFSRIIWHHIPRFSAGDYMVATKILSYTSKAAGQGANVEQLMHMRHLQSRVRFCFKLGPEFAKHRVIHVKEMKITNLRGHMLTMTIDYETDLTKDVYDDEEGTMGYPQTGALWSIEPEALDADYSVTLTNERNADYSIKEYIELSEATRLNPGFQPLASVYVYPQDDISAINIDVTYDVYDLEGVLLRKDDHAANTIPVNFVGSLNAEYTGDPNVHILEAGYYYDINIVIEPSYLYVLSDNDFNADGYLIITP